MADDPKPDRADVVGRPPLIFLGGLVAGFGLSAVLPLYDMAGWLRWGVGPGPFVLGVALMMAAFGRFSAAGASVPTNEPTSKIVTDGPYGHTRNPIYLGFALIHLGIAMMADSLWAVLLLIPVLIVIDRGVIRREEAYLADKFGDTYLAYKARTRRWM